MIKNIFNKLSNYFRKPELTKTVIVPDPFPSKPASTIKVFIGDKVVGAIQSISISEKSIDPKHPEVSAYRVRLDRPSIDEIFSRGFVHVASQKIPFKIQVDNQGCITTIHNAWITSLPKYTYTVNDWIIVEEMVLQAETITLQPKQTVLLKPVK